MSSNLARARVRWTPLPCALLLLLLLALPASAQDTITVGPGGDHATIQAAIDAAADGDTIQVAAGVYPESLLWEDKQLILQGAGPGETIIDPSLGPGGRGMFAEDLPEGSALRGFTVQNGGVLLAGGGLVAVNSHLWVDECEFTANIGVFADGGGIYNNGELTVTNSSFTGNRVDFEGGAIYNRGELTVTNSSFTGNRASRAGAISNWGELTVTNSSFTGNRATGGGGGIDNESVLTVTNSTFAGNSSGILSDGGSAAVELRNSILWGNGEEIRFFSGTFAVAHSNVEGGLPAGVDDQGGNIDADPLFVRDPGTLDEADPGDLRLQEGSPSIDAGNDAFVTVPPFPTDEFGNAVDLDGNPRSVGNAVDMGAYEVQGAAAPTPEELIEELADEVAALVAAGVPLPANGQPLFAKLNAALGHLAEDEVDEAIGALGAFVNQVNAFVRSRRLTPAQAEPLLDAAQAIIAELSAE